MPDKAIDLIAKLPAVSKWNWTANLSKWINSTAALSSSKWKKCTFAKESDDASKKRLELIDEEIDGLQKEYADLDEIWKAEKAASSSTADIKKQMDDIKVKIEQAKRQGDFARASELEYGELPKLGAQLQAAESNPDGKKQNKLFRTEVGADEVAEIVSRMTGIPVSKMWKANATSC